MRNGTIPAVLALAATLTGCGSTNQTIPNPNFPTTVIGQTAVVGTGTSRSFVTYRNGIPTSLGVVLSRHALDSLPATMTDYDMNLPSVPGVPFTHISLDWEPNGHPPVGIYTVPHFDVHFYLLTPAERAAITPTSDFAAGAAVPAANLIPTGYQFDGQVVPFMGVHAEDVTSKEFNGQPFDHTFIYGYYKGHQAFVEPMITRAFLLQNGTNTFPVRQPAAFDRTGYYPTAYTVKYDAASGETTVSLDNLTAH
jgi:hypothetical protein